MTASLEILICKYGIISRQQRPFRAGGSGHSSSHVATRTSRLYARIIAFRHLVARQNFAYCP